MMLELISLAGWVGMILFSSYLFRNFKFRVSLPSLVPVILIAAGRF